MSRVAALLFGCAAVAEGVHSASAGIQDPLSFAQLSAAPKDPAADARENAANKLMRGRAVAAGNLQASTEVVKKRPPGTSEVSGRQQLRSAIREAEAFGVPDTKALDYARITLVESISASARASLTKGVEKGTIPELQAAIAEASTKSSEIEKTWEKVKDKNSTTVATTRFQPQELEDAKHALANEQAREARKVPVRLRLVSSTNGHNPEKTKKALAEAEEIGLSAFEIEQARVALANQEEETKAIDAIKEAFAEKDIPKIEEFIKEGERANVRDGKLSEFRRKLYLLKQPPKPKFEKAVKADKADKAKKSALKTAVGKDKTKKSSKKQAGKKAVSEDAQEKAEQPADEEAQDKVEK